MKKNIEVLKAFFVRRIFRLFPVVFLLIVVGIICQLADPYFRDTSITEELMGLLSHISLQTDFDVINFYKNHDKLRSMAHLWSLAVEERFYLIFPFLILLFTSPRNLMRLAMGIIIGLSLLKGLYPFDGNQMAFNGFLRFDSFMFGMLIYLLEHNTNIIKLIFSRNYSRVGMNLLSIGLLIIMARLPISYAGNDTLYFGNSEYYYLCVYSLSTILVTLAAQDKGYVLNIPYLKPVLAWLGEKSYNIYVFHFLYLALTIRLGNILFGIDKKHLSQNFAMAVFLGFLLFICSWAIYRYWEKPWRDYGRKKSHQDVAA